MALAASNVFAALRARLRSVPGVTSVEEKVSVYDLADELAGPFRGTMVAPPAEEWEPVRNGELPSLAQWLKT